MEQDDGEDMGLGLWLGYFMLVIAPVAGILVLPVMALAFLFVKFSLWCFMIPVGLVLGSAICWVVALRRFVR